MVIPWRVYPYALGSEYQDRSGTGESRPASWREVRRRQDGGDVPGVAGQ
jgi:hypothetical protein